VSAAPARRAPVRAAGPAAAAQSMIGRSGVAETFRGDGLETRALGPVDLEVAPHEFLAIVGPFGHGESTLLRLVAGLLAPSEGRVTVGGRPVTGPVTELGFVFQKPVLLPWRDLLGNVLVQVELRGRRGPGRRARVSEPSAAVGLAGFERRWPQVLSDDIRQRAPRPARRSTIRRFSSVDETSGAPDAPTREQRIVLEALGLATGKRVPPVTRSIAEAALFTDRVVVMGPRPGRIERIVPVPLARPRGLEARREPSFERIVRTITDVFLARGVLHSGRVSLTAAGTSAARARTRPIAGSGREEP